MEDTSRKASRQVLGQALLSSDKTTASDAPQQREQKPQRLHDFSSAAVGDNPTTGSISPRSYDFLAEDGHAVPATSPEQREVGEMSPFSEKRSTSVAVVLRQLATGSSISARGEQWKLTRAVAHLEDAWKGRMSPCPQLDQENARNMFKIRWKYRKLDFLLVHVLLALSLLEVPAWCAANKKCFWSCYPDFSRNWHLPSTLSLVIEGIIVSALVVGAPLDVVRGGARVGVDDAAGLAYSLCRLYSHHCCSSGSIYSYLRLIRMQNIFYRQVSTRSHFQLRKFAMYRIKREKFDYYTRIRII